ncbi:MAG TPA: isoprenylcysteine carboxylmethyltransferase family protein [Myxococcota bacterium]|nr:isoprenylcysteine carboxylmethyltransferase family protein [Myxococcota bacterium]
MSGASNDARMVPVAPTRWLPPQFFALFLVLGAAAHVTAGGPILLRSPWLGAPLAVLGVTLALWGRRTFSRAGAAIRPTERSTLLVTDGPFRFSRNPMYLGIVAALAGVALVLGTPAPWLAALGMALLLRFRFIANEERALDASLGEPYLAYKRRVRRWL